MNLFISLYITRNYLQQAQALVIPIPKFLIFIIHFFGITSFKADKKANMMQRNYIARKLSILYSMHQSWSLTECIIKFTNSLANYFTFPELRFQRFTKSMSETNTPPALYYYEGLFTQIRCIDLTLKIAMTVGVFLFILACMAWNLSKKVSLASFPA